MKRKIWIVAVTLSLTASQAALAVTSDQAVEIARRYVSRFPVPIGMDVAEVTDMVEPYFRATPEPSYMVWLLGPGSDGCDSNSFGVVVAMSDGNVLPNFNIPEHHSSGPFRSTYLGWTCYYDNGPGGGT